MSAEIETAATHTYLRTVLGQFGYEVEEEPFGLEPLHINLLAEIPGTDRPDLVLEVGAHYDTVPNSPGADDNASGIAGILEIARLVQGISCRRTLRLCMFGGEESRMVGSRAHVEWLQRPRSPRVEGAVVFEMIGYRTREPNSQRTPARIPLVLWPPTVGDFISVVSNPLSRSIAHAFGRSARKHVPNLHVYTLAYLGALLKDAARSDHVSYWNARIPAVMLTDTANFRNPNYHSSKDIPHTLDYEFVSQVVTATTTLLVDLADRPIQN